MPAVGAPPGAADATQPVSTNRTSRLGRCAWARPHRPPVERHHPVHVQRSELRQCLGRLAHVAEPVAAGWRAGQGKVGMYGGAMGQHRTPSTRPGSVWPRT
jgi:hypothetical protein